MRRYGRPVSSSRARSQGQIGLEASLAEMMRDERFYARIMELYNDLFLTDKYLGRENAVALLDEEVYPNLRWYERKYPNDESKARVTNDSLAREPLELLGDLAARLPRYSGRRRQ